MDFSIFDTGINRISIENYLYENKGHIINLQIRYDKIFENGVTDESINMALSMSRALLFAHIDYLVEKATKDSRNSPE